MAVGEADRRVRVAEENEPENEPSTVGTTSKSHRECNGTGGLGDGMDWLVSRCCGQRDGKPVGGIRCENPWKGDDEGPTEGAAMQADEPIMKKALPAMQNPYATREISYPSYRIGKLRSPRDKELVSTGFEERVARSRSSKLVVPPLQLVPKPETFVQQGPSENVNVSAAPMTTIPTIAISTMPVESNAGDRGSVDASGKTPEARETAVVEERAGEHGSPAPQADMAASNSPSSIVDVGSAKSSNGDVSANTTSVDHEAYYTAIFNERERVAAEQVASYYTTIFDERERAAADKANSVPAVALEEDAHVTHDEDAQLRVQQLQTLIKDREAELNSLRLKDSPEKDGVAVGSSQEESLAEQNIDSNDVNDQDVADEPSLGKVSMTVPKLSFSTIEKGNGSHLPLGAIQKIDTVYPDPPTRQTATFFSQLKSFLTCNGSSKRPAPSDTHDASQDKIGKGEDAFLTDVSDVAQSRTGKGKDTLGNDVNDGLHSLGKGGNADASEAIDRLPYDSGVADGVAHSSKGKIGKSGKGGKNPSRKASEAVAGKSGKALHQKGKVGNEVAPNDRSLDTLVSMGFDRNAAERALASSGGNVEDAVARLTREDAGLE